MGRIIKAEGDASAQGLLPAYTVEITVLDEVDVVHGGDLLLFGGNPQKWHSWTGIVPNSTFVGQTVDACRRLIGKPVWFGRRQKE